ncbi:hypothetical protein GEMRC1_011625 [Eukaryota sp. GEM-RC1]
MHTRLATQLSLAVVDVTKTNQSIPTDEMLIAVRWITSYYVGISRYGISPSVLEPQLMVTLEPVVKVYLSQLETQLMTWIRSICKADRKSVLDNPVSRHQSISSRHRGTPSTPAATDVLRLVVQTLSLHLRQDKGEFTQRIVDLCCDVVKKYVSLIKDWIKAEYSQLSLQSLCAIANNFLKILNSLSREFDSLSDAAPRLSLTSWESTTDSLLHGNGVCLRYTALRASDLLTVELSELFTFYHEPDGPNFRDYSGVFNSLLAPSKDLLDDRSLGRFVSEFLRYFSASMADAILSFKKPINGIIVGRLTEDLESIEGIIELVFNGCISSTNIKSITEPLRTLVTIFSLSNDDESFLQHTIDLFDSYFKKMSNIWSTSTEAVADRIISLNSSLKSTGLRNSILRAVKTSLSNPKMKPRTRGIGQPFLSFCGLPGQVDAPQFNGFEEVQVKETIPKGFSDPISQRKEPNKAHRRAVTVVDSTNLESFLC